MSDGLAGIPSVAPKATVLDYSGTLTPAQMAAVESQAKSIPGVTIKIVVMPKDFHSDDFASFARTLGTQWRVQGERMLILVDLKDHKVRALVGKKLESEGVTSSRLSSDIIPRHFVPYMKQGDLAGALQNTIAAVQQQLASNRLSTGSSEQQAPRYLPSEKVPTQTYSPAPVQHGSFGLWIWIALILFGVVAWALFSNKTRKIDNEKLAKEYKQRVNSLYEVADQIGQASEYLSTKDHPDVAQKIATFFNRLTTLQQAEAEVQTFEKQNKLMEVRNGYLKLMRMVAILQPEAQELKSEAYSLTGGVDNSPAPGTSLEQEAQEQVDPVQKISIPERVERELQYRRPAWTYEPVYVQQAPGLGLGGLMQLGMLLNQMEMNSRLDQMAYELHNEQPYDSRAQQSGGGWFGGWGGTTGGSFSDSGGSWGNTGHSEQSGGGWFGGGGDSGGGFDSGGGDWGGGDSGGFDSGGGDW